MCLKVPPGEAAHSFSAAQLDAPRRAGSNVTSHLLPTYARVNLAFERGEGAWLIATNGDRYLDFTSGVAVNALGHAHPQLIAAVTEQLNLLSENHPRAGDGDGLTRGSARFFPEAAAADQNGRREK